MLFNSYIFIFLFFPLCLAGFYLLERRGKAKAAKVWLTGFSLWFYGYFNLYYLGIMAGSILFNFLIFKLLLRRKRRGVLAVGVGVNLAVLFYFKYFDFFVENINALFSAGFLTRNILLPLGISFFTFQQIGFLVDAYRGETEECSLVEYALFVSFFPQLIAGPIVNFQEMMPQFRSIGQRKFSRERFAKGLYLFTLGMAKKVLLADTFGIAVDYGYGNIAVLNGVEAVLVMLFYTLQLYFDFSGYCDMARGLGRMLGIEIPVNFNSPYQSANIIDFWKRWHITLNRFLMRYVYIPLGGNRKGKNRMLLNLMLVFFISGVWHGAGWNFVVWGVMHGAVYVLTRIWQMQKKERPAAVWSRVLAVLATFLFVNIAWVFFRAPDFSQALALFGQMGKGGFGWPSAGIYEAFNLEEFWYVLKVLRLTDLPYSEMYLCAAFVPASLGIVFFHKNAGEMAERFCPKFFNAAATAVLFLWCVLSLSGVSTFLYFNF
ncbi:MAG: MBOAT family protein [Eubacteriales bacterium]|nr:MBOAT family protein [Eubacteriales bacterium]